VLISGSTGEQHSLTLNEKIKIIDDLEKEDNLMENMEIIFGISSIRQKEAEELAKHLKNTRISAIMLGYSPYIIPSQDEAITYTESIIKNAEKPTILYNNPKRTGFDLASETILKLSENNLVIGVKDPGEKDKVENIKNRIKKKPFYFYSGGEINLKTKIENGYNRLSSIAGNIYPKEINRWFNKLLTKEKLSPQEEQKIEYILNNIYSGNAILNIKKISNQTNTPMGKCRKPIGNTTS
ncbi:dihydrodipicolinate synthase family protein, partial [Staphylococcus aureus]|uniref:dihydrodipicolinate synthase family protein n=1 Tax=Staphylococcus aureus TaxID=1280 RepID=UPI00352B6676